MGAAVLLAALCWVSFHLTHPLPPWEGFGPNISVYGLYLTGEYHDYREIINEVGSSVANPEQWWSSDGLFERQPYGRRKGTPKFQIHELQCGSDSLTWVRIAP